MGMGVPKILVGILMLIDLTSVLSDDLLDELFRAALRGNVAFIQQCIANDTIDFSQTFRYSYYAFGNNVLMAASEENQVEVVKLLLNAGAPIDQQNELGWSSLMLASKNNGILVVKLLLESGATIDLTDNAGRTALMLAADAYHIEVIKLLVEAGANVDQRALEREEGFTPLLYASFKHIEGARLLLEAGADVNLASTSGRTPLIVASERGYINHVKMFLGAGAKVDHGNLWGKTALMKAVQNNKKEIVEILFSAGATVDLVDDMGLTALHFTAELRGCSDIAKILLKNGANPVRLTDNGDSLVSLARKYGNNHLETFIEGYINQIVYGIFALLTKEVFFASSLMALASL